MERAVFDCSDISETSSAGFMGDCDEGGRITPSSIPEEDPPKPIASDAKMSKRMYWFTLQDPCPREYAVSISSSKILETLLLDYSYVDNITRYHLSFETVAETIIDWSVANGDWRMYAMRTRVHMPINRAVERCLDYNIRGPVVVVADDTFKRSLR